MQFVRFLLRSSFIFVPALAIVTIGCGQQQVAQPVTTAESKTIAQDEASARKAMREARKGGTVSKKKAVTAKDTEEK
jgi:hypothetical protein